MGYTIETTKLTVPVFQAAFNTVMNTLLACSEGKFTRVGGTKSARRFITIKEAKELLHNPDYKHRPKYRVIRSKLWGDCIMSFFIYSLPWGKTKNFVRFEVRIHKDGETLATHTLEVHRALLP